MLVRLVRVLLLLAVVLAPVSMGFAQGDDQHWGLSPEDFDMLLSANTSTLSSGGLRFDFTLDLDIGSAEQSMKVALSGFGELATKDQLAYRLVVEAEGNNVQGQPVDVQVELLLVEGMMYTQTTDLKTGKASGWTGQSFEQMLIDTGLPPFLVENLGLGGGSTGDAPGAGWLGQIFSEDELGALQDSLSNEALGQYVHARRLQDSTVEGVETAHFYLAPDLLGLLGSEGFATILSGGMAVMEQSGAGEALGQAGVDPSMIGMLLRMMFTKFDLTIDQYVGLKDGVLHQTTVDLSLGLNPMLLGGQTGGLSEFGVYLDVLFSGFGETYEIVAPDTYTTGSILPK